MSRKNCIKCGVPLSAETTTWYRQKNHIHKCNDCIRVEKADWAREAARRNPVETAERSRRSKQRIKIGNPKKYSAGQMRASAKKRADALGLPFDLSTSQLTEMCVDVCPILGVEIKYGGGTKTNESASLDRIVPSLGYVPGNVQVVSLLANLMKNEATPEEMLKFADWAYARFGVDTRKVS